jgi:hypothetical protein
MQNAVGDGTPPILSGPNAFLLFGVLVEPDVVAAPFQVDLDAADQFLVGVVPVAKENAKSRE